MGLVVLVVSGLSLVLMVKGVLGVPIEGSIAVHAGRGAQSVCHHVNRHFYRGR